MNILEFKLIEKGQWAYLLWPWTSPAQFLYDMLAYGAKYEIAQPYPVTRSAWIEFLPGEGTCGEYRHGPLCGETPSGTCVYRKFNRGGTHYITQHGLDGIARALWEQAYKYTLGVPGGDTMFQFKIGAGGGFTMTFHDWQWYFVSGRNGPIKDMAIQIIKH